VREQKPGTPFQFLDVNDEHGLTLVARWLAIVGT